MLAIPLFGGGHTCVDEKHFDELAKYNWSSSAGYAKARIKEKPVLMSRMIMKAKKGELVDHINGNKLLNTESNLRVCTRSQNAQNRPIQLNNTSGYKGISLNKLKNKWEVRIIKDCQLVFSGYFDKLEDAIEASKEAYAKYHGAYACFEREEVDLTEFYMAKWNPKSIELFAKKQEPKSSGILNLMSLTVIIPTTQDQVAIVDIFDYNLVSQHKWRAIYDKHTGGYYAYAHELKSDGKHSSLTMHRLVTNAKKDDVIDHKNGITMDNRGSNLRKTDNSGNMRNRGLFSSNTSGTSGVSFHTSNGTWNASYRKNGKLVHIGSYKTKEEAVAARLAAVELEYGEFLRVQS